MNTPTKLCTKCKRVLPATPEHFNRSSRNKTGYYSSCRECRAEYRLVNADRLKAEKRAEYRQNRERYLAYARSDAGRASANNYYRRNRETLIRKTLERQRRDHAATLQKRREQYRANPEVHRARVSKWRRQNQEKVRNQYRQYRARRYSAPGIFTDGDIDRILRTQGNLCFWCSEELDQTYHVDHVIPLSRHGTNEPENLVVSCPRCNSSKKDRIPYLEWDPPCPLLG